MSNAILEFAMGAAAMAAAAVGFARCYVNGVSTLGHQIGAHRQGWRGPAHAEVVGELVNLSVLGPTVQDYRADHFPHHALARFAGPRDPDAQAMARLGFTPGRPFEALKRNFWRLQVSPGYHLRLTRQRLRSCFGQRQPVWRLATAWGLWLAILLLAAAGGLLLPVLLGMVLPLLLAGNVAKLWHNASEHAWLLDQPQQEAARQVALCPGRHPLPPLPPDGASVWRYVLWWLKLGVAALQRFVVCGGDNGWHHAHHGRPARLAHLDRWSWTNATWEFSGHLWAGTHAFGPRYASLGEGIDAWLLALSQQKPMAAEADFG